jgi:leucyl aminopeptidase
VPLTITTSTAGAARAKADLLAIGVHEGSEVADATAVLPKGLPAGLGDHLAAAGFEGKVGSTAMVPAAGVAATSVVLVGLGKRDKLTLEVVRRAAAALARRAAKSTSVVTTLADAVPAGATPVDAAQAVAEGALLGGYEFLEFRSDPKPTKFAKLTLLGPAALRPGVARGETIATATNRARDLINRPGGALNADDMAEAARAIARDSGLKIEVLDAAAIKRQKLGGLLGVNAGSTEPPRFVKLTYTPSGRSTGTVALVGKGITFDSGGLSLKPSDGMITMKTDMSGGAAVIGAMSALGALGVKTKVLGFVPMTDNMPGGSATKLGDVLTMRGGKTVEIHNTDAEGRLILADALVMASEQEPDAIIDLATLTGACMVALGDEIAGIMSNHDGWRDQVKAAADVVGEAMWPLPLPDDYRGSLDSEIADLKNVSAGRYGGALTAGLFLREFVADGIPWVHLDIAGPARANADKGYLRRGGTGFGVRTLIEVVSTFRAP